ncbi:MAG: hypothetical protein ACXWBN_19830, partial [Acidimicrobiales bacterium]
MGSKVRCPGCGAKNDSSSHRCRICTNVINAEAVARNEEVPAPSATSVLDDHFDADEINRQIQPARSRFGGETGGL